MFINNIKTIVRRGDGLLWLLSFAFVFSILISFSVHAEDGFKLEEAKWDAEKARLTVKGEGIDGETVTVSNAGDDTFIGNDLVEDNKWRVRISSPETVPCRVRVIQSDGASDEKDVKDAPENCDSGMVTPPPATNLFKFKKAIWWSGSSNTLVARGRGTNGLSVSISNADTGLFLGSVDVTDKSWRFKLHNPTVVPCRVRAEQSDAQFAELDVIDAPLDCDNGNIMPPVAGDTSINSTSQNGALLNTPVPELALAGQPGYSVFAVNDLGMHCGDFDTRISSILPPFNVLHAQVIQKGGDPKILGEADGVSVAYSAASNPFDPILAGVSPSGEPLLSSVTAGNVYKTNFWDIASGSTESIALKAYRPFYPPGILDAFVPVADQGLPMPDVERLYLGDGVLAADQQNMPGIAAPYILNDGQNFNQYVNSLPFFLNFPFGYTSADVNWFEAAGVPASAFDDAGRENPYPLYRVQAHSGGVTLASVDAVAPISGEANCKGCHGSAQFDDGNGSATKDLTNVAISLDDPLFGEVPAEVSKEYAADINILRLHDQKHGTFLEGSTPVVCQSCHYTPALDLAQVGPLGPENDPVNANGRDQAKNKSMSNVMHSHHATVTGLDGQPLFPSMPPAVDTAGNLRDPVAANDILQQTCYQCHPGKRTSCLRGAMASGGMLCQDCHGDMAQVGDDFSRLVSATNVGAFELGSDFYTNPATPRVPWANEPGCGSCHTGDAMDNLHGTPGTVSSPVDGIRLMQAWMKGDPKATPIVPTNKRFAETVVASTGNPQLYRISTGHEGVLCESCHGATHAIFPNGNPSANDNVASTQLQGHTGVISECDTCHTGDLGITLDGPHGMHPVGSAGNDFADGGHEDIAENNPNACRACHGQNGQGTVLSEMHVDRVLKCDKSTNFCPNGKSVLFPEGHQVTCSDCHENKL